MSKIKNLENEIKRLPKQYRDIDQINEADELYYQLEKERFKERTGKKIARGFMQSDEYGRWRKNLNQRRRRFKTRIIDDVDKSDVVMEPTAETPSTPFWNDLWYKNGTAKQLLNDNQKRGGDFVGFIKKFEYINGNRVEVDSIRINNRYDLDRQLKSLYREFDQKKRSGATNSYFFTTTKIYQIDDLSIMNIEIDLD